MQTNELYDNNRTQEIEQTRSKRVRQRSDEEIRWCEMTAKEEIPELLRREPESCTPREIAEKLSYSTNHVRRVAKELRSNGKIEGRKSREGGAPMVVIRGNIEVITGNRDQLIELVKKYSPSDLSKAKAMPTDELIEFVRDVVADGVAGVVRTWEFWN